MRILALLMLAGCGPVEPPCLLNAVQCSGRCVDVCRDTGWERLRCAPCGQSDAAAGAGVSACRVAEWGVECEGS